MADNASNSGKPTKADRAPRRGLLKLLAPIAVLSALLVAGLVGGVTLEGELNFSKRAGDHVTRTWDGLSRQLGLYREPDVRAVEQRSYGTFFYMIRDDVIPLGPFDGGRGGTFSQFGDGMIFIEPKGQVGYVSLAGQARYEDLNAPMNMDGFVNWLDTAQQGVYVHYFRVLDSLMVDEPAGGSTFYVSHLRFADTCVEFVISKIGVTADASGAPVFSSDGWSDVFVAKPCVPLPPQARTFEGMESGGRMVLSRQAGHMIVTIGHFGFDGLQMEPAVAMDPNVDLGKVVDVEISTGRSRIISMGHRNPQGLAIDSEGRIWETEHGPDGGDELNHIQQGRNYGWPLTTYGLDYGSPRKDWPTNAVQGRHDPRYEPPRFFWAPSMGLSEVMEASGDEFPRWNGDLLVASLSRNMLMRLRREGDRIVSVESIPVGERIRDMITMRDGRIAMLTDEGNIHILQRERTDGEPGPTPPAAQVSGMAAIAQARAQDALLGQQLSFEEQGRRLYNVHCSQCHSLGGAPSAGPSLRGVIGRDIASVEGYAYSPTLREMPGKWEYNRLNDFIGDPQGQAPGTTMPDTGVHKYDTHAILAYIASL